MKNSISEYETMRTCESCLHYMGGRECTAFASIPDRYWRLMFLKDKPTHTRVDKDQTGPAVYVNTKYSPE